MYSDPVRYAQDDAIHRVRHPRAVDVALVVFEAFVHAKANNSQSIAMWCPMK